MRSIFADQNNDAIAAALQHYPVDTHWEFTVQRAGGYPIHRGMVSLVNHSRRPLPEAEQIGSDERGDIWRVADRTVTLRARP